MNAEKFGAFLQQRRRELGMTQADLAQRLHVTAKAVSRWERAVGFPDINTLQPLAEALELTITELMQSRRLTAPEQEQLSVDTVKLIREQEEISRKRKLVLRIGQAVIFGALLFLLIQVRRAPWEEPWLVYVVRGLLTLGGFGCMRMWEYILEKGWLKDRPFGIWHDRSTWVWVPLGFAGAMLMARSWAFRTPAGWILALLGGFALIFAALWYYAKHEYEAEE